MENSARTRKIKKEILESRTPSIFEYKDSFEYKISVLDQAQQVFIDMTYAFERIYTEVPLSASIYVFTDVYFMFC